jgi:hypothetical protein
MPECECTNSRFRRQAIRAANLTLAMWIIRIPCGLFALLLTVNTVYSWLSSPASAFALLRDLFILLPMVIALANVALRGRSPFMSALLTGEFSSSRVNESDK